MAYGMTGARRVAKEVSIGGIGRREAVAGPQVNERTTAAVPLQLTHHAPYTPLERVLQVPPARYQTSRIQSR